MRTISFSDALSITRNMFKPEKELDAEITRFFKRQFSGDVLFLDHGSSALQAFIDDFKLQNTEIILPSFICSDVFVQLCIQNNITPHIVDCEQGKLGISVKDVEKVLTQKTKAVIIVHVLGVPNDPLGFQKLCKKNNLLLLEDCAHCLSVPFKGKYLGAFGDAAIFSFAKEMPAFVGGAYLNNQRTIASSVRDSVQPYRFTRSDGSLLLHKIPFTNFLRKNSSLQDAPELPKILSLRPLKSLPNIGKAFFTHFISQRNIAQKKKIGHLFHRQLVRNGITPLFSQSDLQSSSGKSIPLLVQDREMLITLLEKKGLHPGIGWNPVFSKNVLAQKSWNLPRTPRAEKYSRNLLTLSLDELEEKKIQRLLPLFKSSSARDSAG